MYMYANHLISALPENSCIFCFFACQQCFLTLESQSSAAMLIADLLRFDPFYRRYYPAMRDTWHPWVCMLRWPKYVERAIWKENRLVKS